MERSDNITGYLCQETRGFDQLPLNDVDLLAFAALLYVELERFPQISEDTTIALGDFPRLGALEQFVEHDYNPEGMLPFLETLVVSPRFAPVIMRRFRCVVDEERCIQFAAATFDVTPHESVLVFRGTDAKYVGWREDFRMICQEAMPSQEESLRYLEQSCKEAPFRSFVLCGHSKGGACAEYAGVFAPDQLADRIIRVVSFDGPSLLRAGSSDCPELQGYDQEVKSRYQHLMVPVTRYVFRALVGLILEDGDLSRFTYTDSVEPKFPHNVCSVKVTKGGIVPIAPTAKDLAEWTGATAIIKRLSLSQRAFLADFLVDAFQEAGVVIDLGLEKKQLVSLLWRHYRTLGKEDRRTARSIVRIVLKRHD